MTKVKLMSTKKLVLICINFSLLIAASISLAAGIDPSLTTPAEQFRQRQLDSQEQARNQQILKSLRDQQEVIPDIRNDLDAINKIPQRVATDIPDDEMPCFIINEIKLVGEDASNFQFALDQVLNDYKNIQDHSKSLLGSCLGLLGINAVIARVQNVIIEKGYVTTRVLVAPQDLKIGILNLSIIPGRVSSIKLTPDSDKHISPWLAIPINSGDILNLRDIEQGLENLKRVPTSDTNMQIQPSELDKPGFSDLVIKHNQKFPIRISLGIDDSGLNSTDKYIGSTTVSIDNPLALSDLLYFNYNHDLGGGDSGKRGTKGYTAHYSVPWDYWLLSATSSFNEYHQEVVGASQNYIYSGSSENIEVKLNRLIYRNSINKTNLSLKGFLRKSKNFIEDTEIEVQRRRTAGWELGFNQSWYLGAAILDYNLAYRRGTGAFDALAAPEEGFDEGSSRMKVILGDVYLNVPFSLNLPWGSQSLQYNMNWRGQANYTPLTPQDRFSIGNRFTVRGFDGQQTLIADHGWLIRNELIAPIASSGQSIYLGLDYGEVGGQSSKFLIGKYLAGTVLGVRGAIGAERFGSLSYDMFVGKPINKPSGFVTHESVAGFSLNYSY